MYFMNSNCVFNLTLAEILLETPSFLRTHTNIHHCLYPPNISYELFSRNMVNLKQTNLYLNGGICSERDLKMK